MPKTQPLAAVTAVNDSAIPEFVKTLARSLLDHYSRPGSGLAAAKIPKSAEAIAKGLVKLALDNYIDLKDAATGATNAVLDSLHKQIQRAQSELGISPADGFLGTGTLESINGRCLGVPVVSGDNFGNRWNVAANAPLPKPLGIDFVYKVEGKLPDIDGDSKLADQLIEEAWNYWQKIAGIRVFREDQAKAFNILITTVRMDGQGNTLADATVGQGHGTYFPMSLRIDQSESWSRERFLGTIAHEIGHLLGLRHSTTSGQLMYHMYQNGVTKPGDEDRRRILELWPESPGVIQPPLVPAVPAIFDIPK